MKITRRQLKQILKEELRKVLNEQSTWSGNFQDQGLLDIIPGVTISDEKIPYDPFGRPAPPPSSDPLRGQLIVDRYGEEVTHQRLKDLGFRSHEEFFEANPELDPLRTAEVDKLVGTRYEH